VRHPVGKTVIVRIANWLARNGAPEEIRTPDPQIRRLVDNIGRAVEICKPTKEGLPRKQWLMRFLQTGKWDYGLAAGGIFLSEKNRNAQSPQTTSCPLYSQKRTCAMHSRVSAKGQKRTLAKLHLALCARFIAASQACRLRLEDRASASKHAVRQVARLRCGTIRNFYIPLPRPLLR
jgi:hypothetical protein